jgi:hypothetical protein
MLMLLYVHMASTGHPGQDSQNSIALTGEAEQDRQAEQAE